MDDAVKACRAGSVVVPPAVVDPQLQDQGERADKNKDSGDDLQALALGEEKHSDSRNREKDGCQQAQFREHESSLAFRTNRALYVRRRPQSTRSLNPPVLFGLGKESRGTLDGSVKL